VIEPIFEQDFCQYSYSFRPGKSCKDPLRRVEGLLKKGYKFVVDADIKGYFDGIPQDKLMALVEEKIADGRVLALLNMYLSQKVIDTAVS